MADEAASTTKKEEDTQADNRAACRESDVLRVKWRPLRLAGTCLWLAIFTAGSAIALAHLGRGESVPDATANFDRLWLLAALGGLLGGSIRGVFMLIAENYAFEYRCRTGDHSEWAFKLLAERCGLKNLEDKLDPLTNWWAYLLKPVMGMGFGFLFGLLQLIGLIPFIGNTSTGSPATSVVVVSIIAGVLTEDAVGALHGFFAPERQRPLRRPRTRAETNTV